MPFCHFLFFLYFRLSNSTDGIIVPSIYGGTLLISANPEDTYIDMTLWTKVNVQPIQVGCFHQEVLCSLVSQQCDLRQLENGY